VRETVHHPLGPVHVAFGICALALGLGVLMFRKGTRLHRTLGHLYLSSMIGLNATALSIYELFDGFGPFHLLALVSLITVGCGALPVIARRPRHGWLRMHAYFMSWSYVGLLAATAAEIAVRIPGANFAVAAVASSMLVTAVGALTIHGRSSAVIHRAMRSAAAEPEHPTPGLQREAR
jgi:uncharacterized membrane protein